MPDKIVYLWLDFETTGLNETEDQILEAAWGFTDQDLVEIGELEHRLVERPNWAMPIRNPTVLRMHIENGLLLEWVGSTHWTTRLVEQDILSQIRELGDVTVQLAGSGVHFDQRWIKHHMPELDQALHYRIGVDISQLERFLRDVCHLELPVKPESEHRAVSDVLDSLGYARDLKDLIDRLATTHKAATIEGVDDED